MLGNNPMHEPEIQIITPPVADQTEALDHGLVVLTEAVCQATGQENGFGLGGRFGYGENFENGVFAMRRFYWGDCDCGWEELEGEWADKNEHAPNCYWNVTRRLIEDSPQHAACLASMEARNRHPWGSKAAGKAQETVEAACKALDEFEETIRRGLCEKHSIPWNDGSGCAVHCTCGLDKLWQEFLSQHPGHKPTCALELPNFLHKRTGLEVRWYKWIGRDMKTKNADGADLQAIFAECATSLTCR